MVYLNDLFERRKKGRDGGRREGGVTVRSGC